MYPIRSEVGYVLYRGEQRRLPHPALAEDWHGAPALRLTVTPLCEVLNLYAVYDEGGLVGVGADVACARLLTILGGAADRGDWADEFEGERLRETFERWLGAL